MKMAIGSDSTCNLTDVIVDYLGGKGIELLRFGALADKQCDYVDSARETAEAVACGACDQGLLFCNTGTGVTIIANKVPGAEMAKVAAAVGAVAGVTAGAGQADEPTPAPEDRDDVVQYTRRGKGWETFSCRCGKHIQLSPAFSADYIDCRSCGRTIHIKK